jgi:hypothetical protein
VLIGDNDTAPATDNYSQGLRKLVWSCLNYKQEDRPTLRKIIAKADRALQDDTLRAEVLDNDGLGLRLPGSSEFEIGRPVKKAKRMEAEAVKV